MLALALVQPGEAVDSIEFQAPGASKPVVTALKAASALMSRNGVKTRDAQTLFAEARAEYGRLLGALYALGYFAPVIHVYVNGREAADIAPLDAPATIATLKVTVETGPQFHFSRAEVAPLAPGTEMPEDFRRGAVALSGSIQTAVTAGLDGWRADGHAKVAVKNQSIVADHRDAMLAAQIGLAPGPVLRFGPLTVKGANRMRVARVIQIAGLTPGLRYSPAALDRAAARLRQSGVFSSVTLSEDTTITPPDVLGVTAQVVEAPLHHYSLGAEVSTLDGATLTGEWLHRNLFGGGERLTISGDVANIDAQSNGMDYALGVTLDRPATPGPDTTASLSAQVSHEDQPDFVADNLTTGLNFTHWFNPRLTGNWGVAYAFSKGHDGGGDFLFRSLEFPLGLTWDNRDSTMDPTKGVYLGGTAKPFRGFGITDDGLRLTLDARGYKSYGNRDALTFAARVQGGTVLGADVLRTPRDDLFYAGGGGTVRGLPYQSLGAQVLSGGKLIDIGGTDFVAGSAEARWRINGTWGAVAFLDAALVDIGSVTPTGSNWGAGAGIGVRYETGFGPIRLDAALPVHGGTRGNLQLYIGLGQSF